MATRIFVVENHRLFQKALTTFLNRIPNCLVCGIANTATDALSQLLQSEADVVLVSNILPDMSGIEVIRNVQAYRPHLPCILFASSIYRHSVDQALAAGARGYVLRDEYSELRTAIDQVADGKIYISPRAA